MSKDNIEVSTNIQWDGQARKIDNVLNELEHEIDAYCIDEEHQNYSASLNYGNGYYNIFGSFSSEELFLEVLRGIYFKNM